MTNRQQIQEMPNALRTTLEKARADFGAVVRAVRWGDGPVLVCGTGDCARLGQAATYAFESFTGWPVVARSIETFATYALPLLKQRSVLLMISTAGEFPEALELAEAAKRRGSVVVVLTNSAENPLAKLADHVLLTHAERDPNSPAAMLALHAALNYLAFECARLLKRPEPHWGQVAEEFGQLPEKLDWLFAQLPSMVRSFGAQISRMPSLGFVGGGFYEYPAWRANMMLPCDATHSAIALGGSEFLLEHDRWARPGTDILFVSGSHSKLRKLIHRGAEQARANGARVLSLTDGNDRQLVEASDLGLLVPPFLEAPASTLALFMLEWLTSEVHRAAQQPAA